MTMETMIIAIVSFAAVIVLAWFAANFIGSAVNGILYKFKPEARLKSEERTIEYRETTRREYYEPPRARVRSECDDDLLGADGNNGSRYRSREGVKGGGC